LSATFMATTRTPASNGSCITASSSRGKSPRVHTTLLQMLPQTPRRDRQ
jgi:hypothetical protein